LQVYDVAEDGKCDLVCGEGIRDCEQDVQCDDGLARKVVISTTHMKTPLSKGRLFMDT